MRLVTSVTNERADFRSFASGNLDVARRKETRGKGSSGAKAPIGCGSPKRGLKPPPPSVLSYF